MAVGFGSYEIAKSGLFVNERALNVTGHNISNLNTPGYVRQQAMIANAPYQSLQGKSGLYQLGLGADVQQIRQIRNRFLDIMYRKENMSYGYWEAKYKTIQDIEAILGDPMEEGLQSVMNQFWDSWHELAKEPESLTVRAIVRQRGETLVNTVNHIGEQLDKLQRDLTSEISVRVNEINNITLQIAQLNAVIYKYEVSGGTANDYRDQRNLLADRLTRLVNAEITETAEGYFLVTIGGYAVVNREKSTKLYVEEDTGNGIMGLSKQIIKLEGSEITSPLKSGTLKGLIDSISEVEETREMLNNLISAMISEINKLHRSGKTMGQPPEDGDDFFKPIKNGLPMVLGNIKLNDNLADLNNIVASNMEKSGDNTIALKISNLRNEPLIPDETGILSIDEYYQSIISKIGQKGDQAASIAENQYNLLMAADAKREALSGVSLDEEMTHMMRFKFAYDASSRAFNAIDEIMETIINRMGLVGR